MRKLRIWQETPDYQIVRHGGGIGYEVTRTHDRASIFLQGDDALTFESDMEHAETLSPAAMRRICEQYDEVLEPANDDPGDFVALD